MERNIHTGGQQIDGDHNGQPFFVEADDHALHFCCTSLSASPVILMIASCSSFADTFFLNAWYGFRQPPLIGMGVGDAEYQRFLLCPVGCRYLVAEARRIPRG